MNLDKLLQGLEVQSTVGQLDRSVGSVVVTDHRKIQTGSVWVCYRGVLIDAHQFMSQAIDKRPIAIIAENSRPIRTPTNIAYIQVGNSRSALARIAPNWHRQPAEGHAEIDQALQQLRPEVGAIGQLVHGADAQEDPQ